MKIAGSMHYIKTNNQKNIKIGFRGTYWVRQSCNKYRIRNGYNKIEQIQTQKQSLYY